MDNKVVKNTAMLYIMNIAKLIFPLLTLPYLTRVLSVDNYAIVTYVKAVMTYMQLIIDFGFLLSATKDIVNAADNKEKIGYITGDVILGKGILALISFIILIIMMGTIPILRQNIPYTLLSISYVYLTIFLVDFLFRGLEKMEVITIRYFITRLTTVMLTFILIRDDSDLLLVPVMDIIGNLVAVVWIWFEIKRNNIIVKISSIKTAFSTLKDSFIYFMSDMASTAFGALNTLLVGILCNSRDIAFWGLAMQLVSAIQALYTPVFNGIYPHMIREKSIAMIKKILFIFMPLITIGCLIIFFGAEWILILLFGEKYIGVGELFKWFIPLLFISFPTMLLGWPVLGAIDKVKETTKTTVIAAIAQIIGLFLLAIVNRFSLIHLALLRATTEFFMLVLRLNYTIKYKKMFSD